MTDDLVKRLRDKVAASKIYDMAWTSFDDEELLDEAADRIEKLEAALREIAAGYETEWSTSTMDDMLDVAQILSERINIARKALEVNDD